MQATAPLHPTNVELALAADVKKSKLGNFWPFYPLSFGSKNKNGQRSIMNSIKVAICHSKELTEVAGNYAMRPTLQRLHVSFTTFNGVTFHHSHDLDESLVVE